MSSPNVSFTQIPANIRKPGVFVEQDTANALNGLIAANDKICILAQRTSAGSVAAKTPTKVFGAADAQLFFGAGSIAHLCTQAIFESNPYADVTINAMDDAGGSADATGKVAFTAADTTSTAAGNVELWIGDQYLSTAYAAGSTAQALAASVKTGIDAMTNSIPFTDSSSDSTVSLIARNKGTVGNYTALSYKITSGTGMTCTLTQPTGGSGDPDLGVYDTTGTVLNAIVSGGYSLVVNTLPTSTALGKVNNMATFVSGPLEQRPMYQVAAATDEVDTMANIQTLCGTTMNASRLTMAYASYASDNLAKSEEYKLAASYAGIISSQSDPVVPLNGLPLVGLAAPSVVDRLTRTQQETLLNAGVTPLEVVSNELCVVRSITTNTTTSGVADPTLLDIQTIRTLDYVRAQVRARLVLRFPRAKMSTKTPARVRSQVLDVLYLLEQLEIVQNVKQYESGVICEQDSSDVTRVNVKIPTNIVTGLHVIACLESLILGI